MQEVIVQQADFNVAEEYNALCTAAPKAGAVVFFVGLVRDLYEVSSADQQEQVEYIELSHYKGMTEASCQQIIDQARIKFPFDLARVVHRVGKIYATEQIVMVAVASRHRDNAFAAAQFIMDYLKTNAPIWKKEVGGRGEQWIGLKDKDAKAADKWSNEQTETEPRR